jgi:hypothetical protein
VLGLVFLKYVSDSFDERRREVAAMLANPASELYFTDDAAEQAKALEDRDYNTSSNVVWGDTVPTTVPPARKRKGSRGIELENSTLQANALSIQEVAMWCPTPRDVQNCIRKAKLFVMDSAQVFSRSSP